MSQYRRIIAILTLSGLIAAAVYSFAQSPSALWENKVPVKVVQKPKPTPPRKDTRRPPPPPPKRVVQMVPLLSLRWSAGRGAWADELDPSKNPKPVNPEVTFKVNDHLQLYITVNQSGYLYIIQEKDLTMVFPDKRIDKGKNSVTKNQPINIPLKCDDEYKDKNGNCWFRVENTDDDLTLIFSRKMIDDLPGSETGDGTMTVNKEVLEKIKTAARKQEFSKTNPNATTIQFTNLDREDNEILMIETKIRHQ